MSLFDAAARAKEAELHAVVDKTDRFKALINESNLADYFNLCKDTTVDCSETEYTKALEKFIKELETAVAACLLLHPAKESELDSTQIVRLGNAVVKLQATLVVYTAFAAEQLATPSETLSVTTLNGYYRQLLEIIRLSSSCQARAPFASKTFKKKLKGHIAAICKNGSMGLSIDQVRNCGPNISKRMMLELQLPNSGQTLAPSPLDESISGKVTVAEISEVNEETDPSPYPNQPLLHEVRSTSSVLSEQQPRASHASSGFGRLVECCCD